MNLLFQTRKPRRFHHEMIYHDERKERLKQIEERAKNELEMGDGNACRRSDDRPFQFVEDHRRRVGRGVMGAVSTGGLVLMLLLLLFLLLTVLL